MMFEIVHRQHSMRVFDSLLLLPGAHIPVTKSLPFRGVFRFSLHFSFSLPFLFLIHTRARICTQRANTRAGGPVLHITSGPSSSGTLKDHKDGGPDPRTMTTSTPASNDDNGNGCGAKIVDS
jgi:hypothetical protein